jgi:hypothetical protein
VCQRVREEVARSSDMGYGFMLASVEASGPRVMAGLSAFGEAREALRRTLRPSDVLAEVDRTELVALLVEADGRAGKSALLRVQSELAKLEGQWTLTVYQFPRDWNAIKALPMFAEDL